jgi:hypothetical protein
MTYMWNFWKPREGYNAILENGKQLGLDKAVYAKSVYRSENDASHGRVKGRSLRGPCDQKHPHDEEFFLSL